ncbi:MAG: hypothetical protein EOO01_10820 [Chitinophagaceae bacterium]|nr:MAG: hypothetical protein EOO01_10820 [Chitinophagaceae bacterium]
MKKFSFALLASFALFACNDSSVEEKDSSLTLNDSSAFKPVTPLTIADTLMAGSDSTGIVNSTAGVQTTPVQNPVTVTPTSNSAVAPAVSKPAGALNPAHGQPGHRCDIAVGAPLSSAPKGAAAPVVTQSTPVAKPATTGPATITPVSPALAPKSGPGVKLNPPHGEPGHDCAVQVGAPLKG